jgi:hypothetical protein
MKLLRNNQSGFIIPLMIATALVICALGFAIASVTVANLRFSTHEEKSLQALNIAEAGINYYLWHLSHNSTDYQDGTGAPATPPYGPYVHSYTDTTGKVIGSFTLYITPPNPGSTVTTVKSIGQVSGINGTRTVQAQLGIPSFASYGLLTGTEVWFGPTESTNGPVQSNVGVHMDGTNNGPVTASNATYTPAAEFGGDGKVHNGVWGNGGPTSQWQFPVPTVDFSQVTANLQTLMTQAQANGVYLGASGTLGYYLHLKSNGTVDIYTVRNETAGGLTTTFVRNQAAPANGIFYVSDNVWVDGTGYSGRMTIASGKLPDNPSTNTSITVINNLTYAAKDGSSSLGLIAQNNVAVAPYAPSNLEIDAALLAQKGHVWFADGGPVKTNLTFYGSIDSYNYWTWSWVNGGGTVVSGYQSDSTTFDSNLTFSPPPSYPTTGSFSVLNWRELLTNP